jgi:predicted TIM-barrel fold metal-dependent hydrolase
MSRILENWVSGKGLPGTLVIDGHIHIGAWPHAATFRSVEEAVVSSRRYLEINGVDAFCALSGGYHQDLTDYHIGNDFLLAVWERLPDRLIPFMSVNANDTPANIISELKRMYLSGVRCIKLINHYQCQYPGDGPNLMALYDFAAENKMLIINHSWTKEEICRIAELYPGVDFIFAHYGLNMDYQDMVLKKYDNVYTNVWDLGSMGWLDRGIKSVGAGKFILGSDGFLNSLSVGIGPVVFADISDDDKRLILGRTLAGLLDKAGALPPGLKSQLR